MEIKRWARSSTTELRRSYVEEWSKKMNGVPRLTGFAATPQGTRLQRTKMQNASAPFETRLFIEFVPSKSGATFPTVNLSTEQIICRVSEAKEEDANAAVDAAVRAFLPLSAWRLVSGPARRDLILKLAGLIERDANALACIESLDTGKPFSAANKDGYGAVVDMKFAAKVLRYYAGWAAKICGQNIAGDDESSSSPPASQSALSGASPPGTSR